MNADIKASNAAVEAEPSSTFSVVPIWLVVLTLGLLYCAALAFDRHGGWFDAKVYKPFVAAPAQFQPPQPNVNPAILRGQFIFENVCAPCHNPDGMGKPNTGPPLVGSEWVLVEKPERLIRIPLYGLNGPITVKDQRYDFPSGGMLAIGYELPEADVAAVLTYIRQAWGNKASPVSAEEVKAVKTQVGKRPPFSPEDLKSIPAN